LKNKIVIIALAVITIAAIILINERINNKINNGKNISYIIIGLTEAKQKYDEGKYIFFDARGEVFYKNGHIKSAINVTLEDLKSNIARYENKYPKDTKIIVYCNGSECAPSYDIAKYLIDRGFKSIEVFYGGWNDWVNAKYPIDTNKNALNKLTYKQAS
jgi:rhodanese-related sulfurtransferase